MIAFLKTKYIKLNIVLLFGLTLVLGSCESDIDETHPNIDLLAPNTFPNQCDTLYFNQTYTFVYKLTDNVELGSINIDIHNNFDHHSHSTEVDECSSEPDKTPVNPYVLIREYPIPGGLTEYYFSQAITIDSLNSKGFVDAGDYHLYLNLTDQTGWSTQKGISIKILKRPDL